MSHYTMLSKYDNSTRLLKIKNKLKIVFFFCFVLLFVVFLLIVVYLQNRLLLQVQSGRILDILWAFLIKQLFHSRL